MWRLLEISLSFIFAVQGSTSEATCRDCQIESSETVLLLQAKLEKESVEFNEDLDHDPYSPFPESLMQTDEMMTAYSYADLLREGLVMPQKQSCNLDTPKYSFASKGTAAKLKNLYWLHIPKTGTSFFATVWNYACGTHEIPLDLNVDAYASRGCAACYDFALMDRYPYAKYCSPGTLSSLFQTQHRPTSLSEITSGNNVISIFRQPNQRMISAFKAKHTSGFSKQNFDKIRGCTDASCFANFPGISGCSTRMLTGGTCADEATANGNSQGEDLMTRADEAVNVVNMLSFVGLTEAWDESVCLFHVMFGGTLNPAELKDIHLSRKHHVDYDEADLNGFFDTADEKVYAAAKARFASLLQEHVGQNKSACEYISGSAEGMQAGDSNSTECSCAAADMQCGLTNVLDCGDCPPGRIGPQHGNVFHPASTASKLKCSKSGQCLVDGEPKPEMFTWYYSKHDGGIY